MITNRRIEEGQQSEKKTPKHYADGMLEIKFQWRNGDKMLGWVTFIDENKLKGATDAQLCTFIGRSCLPMIIELQEELK